METVTLFAVLFLFLFLFASLIYLDHRIDRLHARVSNIRDQLSIRIDQVVDRRYLAG